MYSDCLVMNRLMLTIARVKYTWTSIVINLLKPSRIEFVLHPAPLLAMSDTQASAPQWLKYIYRTEHQVPSLH